MNSLRERKKNKTKATIQQAALQLFSEQGYEDTTIDQIAEAAEVSRATFFRYFPAKADIVSTDVFDSRFLRAYQSQPKELHPIKALRMSLQGVFREASTRELEFEKQREALLRQIPELRTAMSEMIRQALPVLTQAIAGHVSRPIDDLAVRALAGAVIGVTIAVWETTPCDEQANFMRAFLKELDAGFECLEAGFSF